MSASSDAFRVQTSSSCTRRDDERLRAWREADTHLRALEHLHERRDVHAERHRPVAAVPLEAGRVEVNGDERDVGVVHGLEVLETKSVKGFPQKMTQSCIKTASLNSSRRATRRDATRPRSSARAQEAHVRTREKTHDSLLIALEVDICDEVFDGWQTRERQREMRGEKGRARGGRTVDELLEDGGLVQTRFEHDGQTASSVCNGEGEETGSARAGNACWESASGRKTAERACGGVRMRTGFGWRVSSRRDGHHLLLFPPCSRKREAPLWRKAPCPPSMLRAEGARFLRCTCDMSLKNHSVMRRYRLVFPTLSRARHAARNSHNGRGLNRAAGAFSDIAVARSRRDTEI
jgi:hypothetical protein